MQAVRPGNHALGRTGLAGNDQIVAGKIKLFQRQRHKREVALVVLFAAGQAVDESSFNMMRGDDRGNGRLVQNMRENVGLGIHAAERLQHPLSAGHADKPVMDKGHAHVRRPACRRWPR